MTDTLAMDDPEAQTTGKDAHLLDPGMDLTLRPMRYPVFYDMYRDAIKNTWTVEEVDFSTDLVDLASRLLDRRLYKAVTIEGKPPTKKKLREVASEIRIDGLHFIRRVDDAREAPGPRREGFARHIASIADEPADQRRYPIGPEIRVQPFLEPRIGEQRRQPRPCRGQQLVDADIVRIAEDRCGSGQTE